MTLHHGTNAPTTWDGLPGTITSYLTAHEDGDNDRALGTFTADAVVTDELVIEP